MYTDALDSLLLLAATALATVVVSVLLAAGALMASASWLPPVQKGTVAFFHPFADGGGGGERVLWCAVKAVHDASKTAKVVIYAREGVTAAQLVEDAARRFNIRLDKPIQVLPLRRVGLVQPEHYPRFTLLRQALGSVALGWEALRQCVPEVYVDTTGWAFPYPLAWRAGSRVVAYVHYPTISTDMLAAVWAGSSSAVNNDAEIAESPLKTGVKLVYYGAMAAWYAACGAVTHVAAVNSSWTRGHIARLWRLARRPPVLVYPPVDTAELQALPLDRKLKQLYLVSVNQFRPEKNHRLQLEAFAAAKRSPAAAAPTLAGAALREARLKLVGGVRGPADEARLAGLQAYAEELGVADCCEWIVNAPFSELRQLLGGAVGGLHTMTDEHFGISVVEYMAAGCVPIAHNSAGPKMDIVLPLMDGGAEGGPAAAGAAAAASGAAAGGSLTGGGEAGLSAAAAAAAAAAGGAEAAAPLHLDDVRRRRSSGGGGGDMACPAAGAGAAAAAAAGRGAQGGQITGFLATTVEEYADAIIKVLTMDQRERLRVAAAAQRQASRFSTERFLQDFTAALDGVLPP
ncbi:hypothetical protein HYH02_012852 [Chlamydomonas schloesseri]|uniref:GDP-Man:Man(3)GlcNAc(2)-PP-Dol alpha-1,2-mannosyltransferase n=1 Tax=Chlamydomonas schloesseri TaxID=2026947 RepID=A0A835W0I9_9CHLO|nr:hypothetical protein HYH02_012852 [Chlamydomonas schloesseri]|eukprot:KAG2432718.1 hypothetical protein HYH02_012852 [Chlamydomonas schloesseri]